MKTFVHSCILAKSFWYFQHLFLEWKWPKPLLFIQFQRRHVVSKEHLWVQGCSLETQICCIYYSLNVTHFAKKQKQCEYSAFSTDRSQENKQRLCAAGRNSLQNLLDIKNKRAVVNNGLVLLQISPCFLLLQAALRRSSSLCFILMKPQSVFLFVFPL